MLIKHFEYLNPFTLKSLLHAFVWLVRAKGLIFFIIQGLIKEEKTADEFL